ncbi:MAG: GtrA family protein [Proteobacteria bacterium]|nr:GtrA family protein [Pseudomonadota bacterium]
MHNLIFLFNKYKKQVKELFRFGIVGITATLVNTLTFLALVKLFHVYPLLANFIGFVFASFVSYFGNFLWTFQNKKHSTKKIAKFLLVSFMGLGMNSLIVWFFMHYLHLSAYVTILPMITLTPTIIFLLNKFWIFKETKPIKRDY